MDFAERILVVDDEPQVRKMIQSILYDEGYLVETAMDGRQALDMLANRPYTLIITDLMMPEVNGLEVLTEAKAHLPMVEVIVATAHGSLDTAVEALRIGAHDYLTKPFSPRELLHSVKQALAYRHLRLERERLVADLQQQSDKLKKMVQTRNAMVRAGQRIATVLDQQEVIGAILEAAFNILPQVELAAVYYQSAGTELKVTSLNHEHIKVNDPPINQSLIIEVLQNKETFFSSNWPQSGSLHCSELDGDKAINREVENRGKSLVIEPLIFTGFPLGALAIVSGQSTDLDEDYTQLLTMLATQAAIALQNAQLYAEARRVDELEALHEAGQAINRTLDLQETLTTTLAITRSLTGAAIGEVYLYVPEHHRIGSVVTLGEELPLTDADRRQSAEIALGLLESYRTNLALEQNVTMVRAKPVVSSPGEAHSHVCSIQSWLAVPLIRAGNSPVGVLELGSEKVDAFTADDIRLVQVVAAQATAAIENARLYEEVRQRLQQTEALGVISQSISNTLDLSRVFNLVVDAAAKAIPVATHSTLYLLDEEHNLFTLEAKSLEKNKSTPSELEVVRNRIMQQAAKRQTPLRTIWQEEKQPPWSLLVAPLKINEKVIGAILVESPHADAFLSSDETLLNTFASHASIAIQNANLFRELSSAYQDLAQHQEEILHSHKTLQALFDGITDGLYIVDRDLRIVAINHAEATRLGLTPDSLIGQSCNASLWSEATTAMTKLVLDTFQTGNEGNWESHRDSARRGPFTDRDVRTYPIFSNPAANPLPTQEMKSANVRQVIVFAQDVSEKRQLQASLFRSANLAAVGRLASSIAHQINNPLTVIIANGQLMELEADLKFPDYPVVQHIVEAGTQIRQIVQNLLDFSTQDTYHWFETDIQTTIDDALALVAHSLHKSNIEITKQIDDFNPIVASASHLKLLWMNLLLNARDAIIERGQMGKIKICAAQTNSGHIKVQIADNGVGIPPEHQEHLFRPFFTTKAPGQGLGLGLYTCRTIVEQHQGQIQIDNDYAGPGAVVTVMLPLQLTSAN
ncbi:MAG: GAF domain-containing protein [Chloroflexi bacterium]|nr:GAF domain-containing protein [Chloroflexota bacterium]